MSFVGRQKVIDKQLEAMGLWSKMGLMSQFKEVELLDDALDHWGAAVHVKVGDWSLGLRVRVDARQA